MTITLTKKQHMDNKTLDTLNENILDIEDNIKSISLIHSSEQIFFNLVHASIIKTIEFCKTVIQSDKQQHFFSSSLRGICEEYISLKFIHKFAENNKNEIVTQLAREEIYTSSIAQWNFFKQKNIDQKLYYNENHITDIDDIKANIRNLIGTQHYRQNSNESLPSVRRRAKEIGCLNFYNYIYHGTSSLVHFSPRIMMRMGWGNLPEIEFSTENFQKYYKDFNIFYGLYLLTELYEWASSENYLDNCISNKSAINEINNILQQSHRWPELVTFEEMNIGTLSKNLFFKSPIET